MFINRDPTRLIGLALHMSTNLAALSHSAVIAVARHNLILVSSAVAGFAILLTVRYFQSPWRKLPPGPKGLPLIGNVLQMGNKQWLNFMKWKQDFGQRSIDLFVVVSDDSSSGDVFYLNAAGQPIIVLNTQKAAADLLDRRAGIYSDRPRNIVAAEILCGGMAMVFQNYGPLCVDSLSYLEMSPS